MFMNSRTAALRFKRPNKTLRILRIIDTFLEICSERSLFLCRHLLKCLHSLMCADASFQGAFAEECNSNMSTLGAGSVLSFT